MNKPISYQKGTIISTKRYSRRVKGIELKPEYDIDWEPGQFIITKTQIDNQDIIADYTINYSNPLEQTQNQSSFEIIVDNHPLSKIGKLFHSLNEGDNIIFKGARGRFTFKDQGNNIVFIFRNIGIAAAYPILSKLNQINYNRKISIFNFVTNDFPEILQKEISQLKNIDTEYVLIDENSIENSILSTGKISKKHMMEYFNDHLNSTFYLSGASIFNKSLRQKLINIGVDRQNIFREMFG